MKAIVLDRDGVLNELIYYPDSREDESPRRAADLRMFPHVPQALRRLQAAGYTLFMLSNQPSYAKGKTPLEDLQAVHATLIEQLNAFGVEFAACYYSYTHPKGIVPAYTGESVYRKPNAGYLLQASRDFGVDFASSWMVGDRDSDIECGQRVGMNTALITYSLSKDKHGHSQPTLTAADLPTFVDILLARTNS